MKPKIIEGVFCLRISWSTFHSTHCLISGIIPTLKLNMGMGAEFIQIIGQSPVILSGMFLDKNTLQSNFQNVLLCEVSTIERKFNQSNTFKLYLIKVILKIFKPIEFFLPFGSSAIPILQSSGMNSKLFLVSLPFKTKGPAPLPKGDNRSV